MRNSADLRWLALAVKEGATQPVIGLTCELGATVPEFLCIGLVSHIFNLFGDLAVLDFIEQLAAELEVVTLLIDGE